MINDPKKAKLALLKQEIHSIISVMNKGGEIDISRLTKLTNEYNYQIKLPDTHKCDGCGKQNPQPYTAALVVFFGRSDNPEKNLLPVPLRLKYCVYCTPTPLASVDPDRQ